jgi:hypothetical protein
MASEKMGRPGLDPVYKSATRSHAAADAETFKMLAGRPKWLYEMATGVVGGDAAHEPTASLNPNGRLGHDHSGPPYGSAIQHPLFTYSAPETLSGYYINDIGPDDLGDRWITVSESKSPRMVAECYVRPFPEYNYNGYVSPYSRAFLYIAATVALSSETLNVSMWNAYGDQVKRTDSVTVNDTSWPPQMIEFSTAYWDIVPGNNLLAVEFTITGTDDVRIYSASGNQIVKRSH